MRQQIKKLIKLAMVLVMLSSYIPASSLTYAHAEGPKHEEKATENQKDKPTSYTYSTPAGCSLSLLTRRSLQLFDEEKTDLTLSPAQAMYAETNIVKQLGDRWLEVGEKVTIDRALVEDYSKKGLSLTSEQTSAWQYYADQADFNVASIKPESTAVAANTQPAQNTVSNESQDKPESKSPTPKSSSPAWYLWLIVGATLGGMYLMMDRPRKK